MLSVPKVGVSTPYGATSKNYNVIIKNCKS